MEKFKLNKRFYFQHVSEANVRKVVKNLPSDKVSAGEFPIKKIKYDQLYEYIEHFLNLLCLFRKAHSTQHALFRPLQKCQKEYDSGGGGGGGVIGTI